jgi:glucoamylase
MTWRRVTTAILATAVATIGVVAAPTSAPAGAAPSTTAPGAPGQAADFLPSDKAGFGTSTTRASHVWYTLQPGGGTGEIYYPSIGTPAARRLGFVITGPGGYVAQADSVGTHRTVLADPRSLTYRQVDTVHNRWRLETTYVTDPARSALRVSVHLDSLDNKTYHLYALYEPTLSDSTSDDSGTTSGTTLVANDASSASAFLARPAFSATSNGYRGASDGWTDLTDNGRMDWHYTDAPNGNIVQTGQTTLTGRAGHRYAVLTVGFAKTAANALSTAATAAGTSFATTSIKYANGWHAYLKKLRSAPSSLRTATERREYAVSAMVLAASEDKLHPGAYVASPTMPWAWGGEKNPTGPYHLVWPRDLYEIATALIADGDHAGAERALTFLFDKQQKSDGSFPQNSDVTGKPFWTGLQLDEVADPIVLAYQLHRTGAPAWKHVKAAADFLLSFQQDGFDAPYTPQDRWENQSGYSPAAIASEIAGLVCAASIARHNGDTASATKYLNVADSWHAHLKGWTATNNGPYSPKPYFLRLTKDGHPNQGTTYNIGDSGPSNVDQRKVVDPSFLELVRLGVLPANDATVRNSIKVVDAKLSYNTANGRFWHRASFDGYGEQNDGGPWLLGSPDDSGITHGRGWPLLTGERGEYDLAAGRAALAADQLATMSKSANAGGMLPEQVWDHRPPGGQTGFKPGTPTFSATPLAWTHAQFIRLARDVSAGRVVEQPRIVAQRYG